MPDWLAIVLLGIIEGLTEFIPVSSTGHLLLAELWIPRQTELFNIVIQCGAVLAVIPLFAGRCAQMMCATRDAAGRDYLAKLLTAFAITAGGGLVLNGLGFRLPGEPMPVVAALVVGGVLFIVIERWLKGRIGSDTVTWSVAVAVGLGQLVAAVFPGASRSGTTILVALVMGLGRPAATEFSFLVGIPTLLAAGALKVLMSLRGGGAGENWAHVTLGGVVAAGVSFLAVKWFLRYVQSHTFTGFGWYRIGLGLVVLVLFLG